MVKIAGMDAARTKESVTGVEQKAGVVVRALSEMAAMVHLVVKVDIDVC